MYYAQKNKGSFIAKTTSVLSNIFPFKKGKRDEGISKTSYSLKRNNEMKLEILGNKAKDRESQKNQVSKNKIKNGKILTSRNHLGEFEQQIAKKYNMEQIPAGSAGLKICWIARGVAELYINSGNRCGLWDTCASDIILKEAGGFIADTNGRKISYNVSEINLLKGFVIINNRNNLNKISL
jgi:3'-phosphoadenosine 5'-phosphosulfate (PAPS) 3'-phosphatase